MTAKVLVADDSLTIQKVIGITLASSGHELVECLNDTELFRFLQNQKFDLVLLDFNLSDKRSGYELSKQIKEMCPGLPIMIMLGTFDTVDESQLADCGISDKVVKPFESGKFIKKCKDLIENQIAPAEKKEIIHTEEQNIIDVNIADSWTVDAPIIQKEAAPVNINEVAPPAEQLDPLASELAGWSADAGLNLEEKFNKSFPPVIESAHEAHALERLQASSGFSFEEDEEVVKKEITQSTFEIPLDLNQQLISEINEDISPDSFWAVDDVVAIESQDSVGIKETHLDFVVETVTHQNLKTEPYQEHVLENKLTPKQELINVDEVVEKLKISLRPVIEEMVREYCRQSAEKIAWEVIPDLAENIIKKELKEISDSVQ